MECTLRRCFYYSYTLLCAGLHGGLAWRNMCDCNAWLAHTFGMWFTCPAKPAGGFQMGLRHNWGGGLHITNEYWRSGGLDNLFEPKCITGLGCGKGARTVLLFEREGYPLKLG